MYGVYLEREGGIEIHATVILDTTITRTNQRTFEALVTATHAQYGKPKTREMPSNQPTDEPHFWSIQNTRGPS